MLNIKLCYHKKESLAYRLMSQCMNLGIKTASDWIWNVNHGFHTTPYHVPSGRSKSKIIKNTWNSSKITNFRWIDESVWRRLAAIKRNNLRPSVRAGCTIWQKLAGNGGFSGTGDFQPVNYCATRDELRSRFSEQEESGNHSLIPLTSGLRDGKYKMKVVLQLFNTIINNACDGWIEIKELIESKKNPEIVSWWWRRFVCV